jgi:uncharacterized damage-inducible protein DinB
MKASEMLLKSLDENSTYVENAIRGLSADELAWSPRPHSNSIAFLMWHLARVEDLWINRLLLVGKEIYESEGWYKKFGTAASDNGFGYDVEKLSAWPVPKPELIGEYVVAVRKKTVSYIEPLTEKQLDEAKEFGWSKGTTGSALSHLISEIGEHSGQIGYIRGIMKGIEPTPPHPKT